ncbi:7-cyano-7-deazaguanine reductase [Paraflavitalea speifideaquila]|uniref:preQ(1) synthase n=1 Tax=Paraflavitalea speifideaquila TaxID=3076558 RepID=UPI0028E73351|nr:7-cyano-7-deazaguanine reductase [Paraflavitalea speifideiaquila]
MASEITKEPVKTYKDIDSSLLIGIPNPTTQAYEIKIKIPEFTFLGVKEQPDFAVIYLTFYPKKKIIELKSFKHYVFQLRNIVVSYERLINIIYDDLLKVYDPERLRLVMICNQGVVSVPSLRSIRTGKQGADRRSSTIGRSLKMNGR